MLAFSIAAFGVTGLNPATPFAEAACRGAWPVALNVGAALVAAGLSVAACEAAAGTAARQATAPAAATIVMRFTNP
jgi:hypothetical protein